MKYCNKVITLVRVVGTAEKSLNLLGGCTVRRERETGLCDIQFKTHKLRMTVDGVSIRNNITRRYMRLPYE